MTREEKFEIHFQTFKNIYKDVYSDEEIVEKVNWFLDKHETLPKTKESIIVYYYDFLIDVAEIEKFRKDLNKVQIELGHYNKEGDAHQAFELPDISVIINDPIVLGVAANLATELIKTVYRKIRGKKIKKIQGSKETVKDVAFEVEIKESKNKKSQFRIKGELTYEQIDKLIDKIPGISLKNDSRKVQDITDLTKRYKLKEDKYDWEEYDLLEQMKMARERLQKLEDE
ncbi:MAG: hypothetical protein IPH16_02010 [Haliscomenobacter sp.]|nr:hypothetical protein [Haliscomenobacter sp.]